MRRINQRRTDLEYLSNSINHDLGLIELDPVTAVWNNDDLAVRGKARHRRLLLHRLGYGGIASRQNDQRHVTVSTARSNLGGTLRKAFHLAGQGLKKLRQLTLSGVEAPNAVAGHSDQERTSWRSVLAQLWPQPPEDATVVILYQHLSSRLALNQNHLAQGFFVIR